MSFDTDYSTRAGFDAAFLRPGTQDAQVFLPTMSPALAKKAASLLQNPKDEVLKYRHFSVVMHRTRRFAIYSAANVDFNGRFNPARRSMRSSMKANSSGRALSVTFSKRPSRRKTSGRR